MAILMLERRNGKKVKALPALFPPRLMFSFHFNISRGILAEKKDEHSSEDFQRG